MTRKMLTAAMVVVALMVSVLALNTTSADAQWHAECDYWETYWRGSDCAKQGAYPGPFTNHPASPSGAYGWGALNITAAAPVAVVGGTGGGDAPLATTGSESTVLGYVGTGLIAFGAVAMGSRRKFFQGALD